MYKLIKLTVLVTLLYTQNLKGAEYHVAKSGSNNNSGTKEQPFLTIQAAANIAVAGDLILVHKGVYRERINPKNGGINEIKRIIYQAVEGEKVIIKGSEVISSWVKVSGRTWKAIIPNNVFGNYNPYAELVEGDWFEDTGITHHTGEVFVNGKSLFEQNSLEAVLHPKECEWAVDKASSMYVWYAEVDKENTIIWANFNKFNPNTELVEINVREVCFYPSQPGINYITVRGFEMSQAATQWAAPTAEQPGLIGTHWSKGWIIENNIVSNSKNVGVSLGKDRVTGHNVWGNNKQKDGATHYNEVIFNALEAGWSKDKIGSHIVRNNVIFDCGQAGVVGSLGAVFSTISNNHIYNIYTKRSYTGMEMAGVKIHAAIDVTIEKNRIHNSHCGIWLDWMAQGAHITRNILYNNDQYDYHDEVNHGPLMIDHNLFLSEEGISTISRSEGTAFVHNLFAGRNKNFAIPNRSTPYHLPHSTKIKGVKNILGGDNRFFNNIFIGVNGEVDLIANRQSPGVEGLTCGVNGYDKMKSDSFSEGNLFYNGAKPYKNEKNSVEVKDFKPEVELIEDGERLLIRIKLDASFQNVPSKLIDTKFLGIAIVSEAAYEQADGSSYNFSTDFMGNRRDQKKPLPGPFENLHKGWNEFMMDTNN